MRGKLKIPAFYASNVPLNDFRQGIDGTADEKLASPTSAKCSYNFALSDGALKDGVGIKAFSVKKDGAIYSPHFLTTVVPLRLYYYKRYDNAAEKSDDRVLVYCEDGYIYQWKVTTTFFTKVSDLSFSKAPYAVNYKLNGDDTMIFSDGNGLKLYDGVTVRAAEAPEITSMCLHSERLFATTGGEQTALWFSDDFAPDNWFVSLEEAGFIDFQDGRGRLLKAISFENYVYIFRNYGITRLSATGAQTDFSAYGLYLGVGRIYGGSVTDCGKSIIFLSEEGFYSFDGAYSARILKGYDKYLKGVDNSDAKGKFFNGKLYMSLKMKFYEEEERVLFVYDTAFNSAYIAKGLEVRDLEVFNADDQSALMLISEKSTRVAMLVEDGACFGVPLEKIWESNFSDFGIDRRKTLAEISLYSKNECSLIVVSEDGEKNLTVNGSKSLQRIRVGLKGTTFSLTIKTSKKDVAISDVKLKFIYF